MISIFFSLLFSLLLSLWTATERLGSGAQATPAWALSLDLRGAFRREFSLNGDFFTYFQRALSMWRTCRAFLCWVPLWTVACARLDEGFSTLRSDELHAQFGRRHDSSPLVRFLYAVGEGGDAALLEVLVHEGVHDGIVEAVEEPDGLNNGDDHVDCDSVVFLLQIIWKKKK